MLSLKLVRSPRALFLDRVVPSLFCALLAAGLVAFAWWYAKTVYEPESAVITLFVAFALALFCVSWAFARLTPWQKELRVAKDGAVTVVTTRGQTTVPAGKAIGVIIVRYGIALKYRGEDGRDAWLGISSGYVNDDGSRLQGFALIDRINVAIGHEAFKIGRRQQAFNLRMLRVSLFLLGLLVIAIGLIAVVRVATGG